ncbi:MAG: protein kinase [Planctomycetes bacterium]|nr:protein kinase [Planctomycetota bacterium]
MSETKPPTDARLGQLAVRQGLVSEVQLAEALRQQESLSSQGGYRPIGEYLVESGAITRDQLRELIRRQESVWSQHRVLGKYKLIEKIGQGGMGAVWKAEQTDLGNFVAMKLLPRKVLDNETLVARFHREARLMATLNHTNIVQAFDAGDQDGQPYYVMPYLEGASVGEILRRCNRLGIRTTLSIALQVVRGLNYAHQRGMVHRDLKPDNLFITHDGTVKILDLGLTKLMFPLEPKAKHETTLQGFIVGTPHYMSPEQVMGDMPVDGRADLYALGATLYHLVCGRPPFPGEKVGPVLRSKLHDTIPEPLELRSDLPPGVRRLILSLLARKPEDRPSDCLTLEAEIEALLDGKPVSGSALSPGNIVLGVSERDPRTFQLGGSGAGGPAAEVLERSRKETLVKPADPASTSVLPRPLGLPGREESSKTVRRPTPPDVPAVVPPPAAPAHVPEAHAPAEVRTEVGWIGQAIAVLVLVVVTVLITLAVVRITAEARRPMRPPAPVER